MRIGNSGKFKVLDNTMVNPTQMSTIKVISNKDRKAKKEVTQLANEVLKILQEL